MKGITIFTSLVLAVLALCSFMPLADEAEIYDNTVRLHVLANSDSAHDQEVKLCVRDAVLETITEITKNAENAEEAEALIADNIRAVCDAAKETLCKLGEDKEVSVTLSDEYYPTREYEDFKLPSGKYTSLRVMIGEAQGQNWWCVLYPQLCTSTAKTGETLVKTGFSKDQIDILTGGEEPKYRLKFKILEIFEKSFG
ncbi:MAG: stage II sporulation protein R [Ruminococcaceae bacterium]|nr:stage II sporulation protein R [Oscillospiraceae bacterium]